MKKIGFCVLLICLTNVAFAFQPSKKQPNVILIIADDQGWGDLSMHKNPYIETPNFDKMTEAGAQFERFFVSPLCAPTRASLLTGRYHLRTGTVSVSKGLEVMNTEETTLVDLCGLTSVKTLPLDGISLVKQLLENPDERLDRTLFTHVNPNDKELTSQPSGLRNNQYRLVIQKDKTELYDMIADPSQSKDITAEKPEITAALLKQYQNWFNNVSKEVKLNRPISIVGDEIRLPAYESQFSGALKYKEGHGWVHDWLLNWTSPKDTIQWTVDVSDAALYEVVLEYTCSKGQTGSVVELSMGNQKTQNTLTKTNSNEMIVSPDRVPRKEVYEKRSW